MCCILMSGLLKLQTRSRCVQKELALWWDRLVLDDGAEAGPWFSVWWLVSLFSSLYFVIAVGTRVLKILLSWF